MVIGLFPTENPVGGSAPQYLSDVVLKLEAVGNNSTVFFRYNLGTKILKKHGK